MTARLLRAVMRAGAFSSYCFSCLGLVGSRSGRTTARDVVLVHWLDVAHVAEPDGWTGGEDVPIQSRRAEEQWIGLLVVGDAASTGVVPGDIGQIGWVKVRLWSTSVLVPL